jgi:1-piperideine-2-carboxylate/1-pyrroline-2-carboxylate reductase [NAD(P)H]
MLLNAEQTANALPYTALAAEIERLLQDPSVQVPARLVQPLPGGGSLFVMPAMDAVVAITKLITLTPANAGAGRPTIQGDVIVFDIATGERRLVLHGPTVTARRTAAVSLLAAQRLAPNRQGPLLIIGAGVQGRAHLEAFVEGFGVREVVIASRTDASAQALAQHARTLGCTARVAHHANAELANCPLVVTCTLANSVVLAATPRSDAQLCQHFAQTGTVVVDTADAVHEAGDLIQAGLELGRFSTLAGLLAHAEQTLRRPVLFKSCGWAGWDLAAARLAMGGSR